MTIQDSSFPQRVQLWRGALLTTIAHAMWVTQYPTLAYEVSWDGLFYSRQNTQGTYGTIAFVKNGLVGVFRDDKSPRAPWNGEEQYSVAVGLAGLPSRLAEPAETALQYILDEHNGVTAPIMTAAFWSDGDGISAAEPWADVLIHGAHLVQIEAMGTEEALDELHAQYEWSEPAMVLLQRLFERRISLSGSPMALDDEEYEQLVANGRDGLAEARELFAAIGILLPRRWRRAL